MFFIDVAIFRVLVAQARYSQYSLDCQKYVHMTNPVCPYALNSIYLIHIIIIIISSIISIINPPVLAAHHCLWITVCLHVSGRTV